MQEQKSTMKAITDLSEKTITLGRNEYLKVEGSIDTNIYFIESGSFQIYVLDDGEARIIRFGYENDLIVALDSFLTGKPSDFCIQALKKSTVQVIPKTKFTAHIQQDENTRHWWTKILEDLVLQQIEREKDLLTSSPNERYLRVLRRSPKLFQEIPLRHIANYLRMTPETLSRLKKS